MEEIIDEIEKASRCCSVNSTRSISRSSAMSEAMSTVKQQ